MSRCCFKKQGREEIADKLRAEEKEDRNILGSYAINKPYTQILINQCVTNL